MEKIAFFRKNLLSLPFFLLGTMLHSTAWLPLSNIQFLSSHPFSSDLNSWGWSLLLTISHTQISCRQLWFGELALQQMLSWPFLFSWPAAFVSDLPLTKRAALKRSLQIAALSLIYPVLMSCLALPPLLQPSLTLYHSAFLFLHIWLYLIIWIRSCCLFFPPFCLSPQIILKREQECIFSPLQSLNWALFYSLIYSSLSPVDT